ncbi:MAG: hypothetical protein HKN84_14835 [Gammaproteobacteria bacterium]|nr:hypothetical protein [Gammaproteobacteria bacterium]
MLPLRYPWLWRILGWVLVGGVIFGSVAPGSLLRAVPGPDEFQHSASYFVLTVWFAGLYARERLGLIAGIFLTLGLAMEIIQGQLSYRGFDYGDLLANFVGIVVASALSFWFLAGWCQRIEQWLIPVKQEL